MSTPTDEVVSRKIIIEEVLWKPREDVTGHDWSGFRNFWLLTDSPDGRTHVRQSAGINPIARPGRNGDRPAIVVFLTPAGERNRLPWLDEVDLDSGFVRYFGDNRPRHQQRAEDAAGNKQLLTEMELYSSDSPEARARAAPILFFRNKGSGEGEPLTEFLGFGLIKGAHRLTQLHNRKAFSNYAYDCILFNGEETPRGDQILDMGWIDARRSAGSSSESLARAPASWRKWVSRGLEHVDSPEIRRYVHRSPLWAQREQLPVEDSPLGQHCKRSTTTMRATTSTGSKRWRPW